MINFYSLNVAVLSLVTVAVGVAEARLATFRQDAHTLKEPHEAEDDKTPAEKRAITYFKANYLIIYALVMGSDWLQGPYLFSLSYQESVTGNLGSVALLDADHDEFGIDLHTIATLFVLGFLSAGVSAPFIGQWADKYGRKKLCILFTVAYALSCCTKMFNHLLSLAVGRLLGGLATSILFSVFESWLVSSAQTNGVTGSELGAFLGRCTLVNGIVAAVSGIASDISVEVAQTFKGPFVLSGVLLIVAGLAIRSTWAENYGGQEQRSEGRPFMNAIALLRTSPSLIVLASAMTAYETSMYLFVFLWVPTMQECVSDAKTLPLGTIFSAFMVAMMLGSLIYNGILSRASACQQGAPNDHMHPLSMPQRASPTLEDEEEGEEEEATAFIHSRGSQATDITSASSVRLHGKLCAAVLMVAAGALLASTVTTGAHSRFYCFLVFEATVGMYYPVLGTLRSAMLPEDCRATLSALFRVPLNLLVTLALISGMEDRRVLTFMLSALGLSVAGVAAFTIIGRRGQGL